MNMFGALMGDNAISMVKKCIKKLFVHEADKYRCDPKELKIVIDYEKDGSITVWTYSVTENRIWRQIPDKEIEKIIMK